MPTFYGYQHETPSIDEIAHNLSRLPRWCGSTIVPWTVLQHSLAAELLVRGPSRTHLLALLHDVEEAVVNDTPQPYKTTAQADLGDEVRAAIFAELGIPGPSLFEDVNVGEVDAMLRVAEAAVLLHPRTRLQFPSPDERAIDVVWGLTVMPAFNAINEFLKRYETLRSYA